MISLEVSEIFIQDLEDDFVMNNELDLYEFIGPDPVKAFYLGMFIKEWFEKLEKEQRYLYSKQVRHNKEDLEKYENQMKFWINKHQGDADEQAEVDVYQLAEYVLNNMFWEEDTEDLDRIKMAFFFGQLVERQANEKSEDNN